MIRKLILAGLAATLPTISFAQVAHATSDYWTDVASTTSPSYWSPLRGDANSYSPGATPGTSDDSYQAGSATTGQFVADFGFTPTIYHEAVSSHAIPFDTTLTGSATHGTYVLADNGLYTGSVAQNSYAGSLSSSGDTIFTTGHSSTQCVWTAFLNDTTLTTATGGDSTQGGWIFDYYYGGNVFQGSTFYNASTGRIGVRDSSSIVYYSPISFDPESWNMWCQVRTYTSGVGFHYTLWLNDVNEGTITDGTSPYGTTYQWLVGPINAQVWGYGVWNGATAPDQAVLYNGGPPVGYVPPLPLPTGGTPCTSGEIIGPLSGECKTLPTYTDASYTSIDHVSVTDCGSFDLSWDVPHDFEQIDCRLIDVRAEIINRVIDLINSVVGTLFDVRNTIGDRLAHFEQSVLDVFIFTSHAFDPLQEIGPLVLTKQPFQSELDMRSQIASGVSYGLSHASSCSFTLFGYSVNPCTGAFAHLSTFDPSGFGDDAMYLATALATIYMVRNELGARQ